MSKIYNVRRFQNSDANEVSALIRQKQIRPSARSLSRRSYLLYLRKSLRCSWWLN